MKIVVIGAGTTGIVIADIIMESHNFKLAGFVGTPKEEVKFRRSSEDLQAPFLGDHSILKDLRKGDIIGFVVAIGDNATREKVYYEAITAGLIPITIVSNSAIINPSVVLGKGVVVGPGVILSHKVTVGDNVIIEAGVIVEVKSVIGDHCYLYPGSVICRGCTVDRNVALGVRAVIEPGCKIGKNNKVPAGKVVNKDIEGRFKKG